MWGMGSGAFFLETHHVVTFFLFLRRFFVGAAPASFFFGKNWVDEGGHILFRIAACGVRAFVAFENRDAPAIGDWSATPAPDLHRRATDFVTTLFFQQNIYFLPRLFDRKEVKTLYESFHYVHYSARIFHPT